MQQTSKVFKASWKMRNRPVFKATKFREAAALAKRTTGNCFGLIDSVARYRKKLWKSIEGHRQFLRLKQHSPPLLSYISSVLQKPPSPPIFYTFDIVSAHPDSCSTWTWSPLCFIHLRLLTCNELILHSSSSPPRGIHFWGFQKNVFCWCKAGPPHVSHSIKNNDV